MDLALWPYRRNIVNSNGRRRDAPFGRPAGDFEQAPPLSICSFQGQKAKLSLLPSHCSSIRGGPVHKMLPLKIRTPSHSMYVQVEEKIGASLWKGCVCKIVIFYAHACSINIPDCWMSTTGPLFVPFLNAVSPENWRENGSRSGHRNPRIWTTSRAALWASQVAVSFLFLLKKKGIQR